MVTSFSLRQGHPLLPFLFFFDDAAPVTVAVVLILPDVLVQGVVDVTWQEPNRFCNEWVKEVVELWFFAVNASTKPRSTRE